MVAHEIVRSFGGVIAQVTAMTESGQSSRLNNHQAVSSFDDSSEAIVVTEQGTTKSNILAKPINGLW